MPPCSELEWSTPSIKLLDELHVVQQQVHDQALAYLDGAAARLRSRALHVQTRVVTQADPGAAILDFAHPPGIDLIAIRHAAIGVIFCSAVWLERSSTV